MLENTRSDQSIDDDDQEMAHREGIRDAGQQLERDGVGHDAQAEVGHHGPPEGGAGAVDGRPIIRDT